MEWSFLCQCFSKQFSVPRCILEAVLPGRSRNQMAQLNRGTERIIERTIYKGVGGQDVGNDKGWCSWEQLLPALI